MFYLECLILNLPYQLVTTELIASKDYDEQQTEDKGITITSVIILITNYCVWSEPKTVN